MWGTDHDDQPIINAKNLTQALGSIAYNWKKSLSQSRQNLPSNLTSYFKKGSTISSQKRNIEEVSRITEELQRSEEKKKKTIKSFFQSPAK